MKKYKIYLTRSCNELIDEELLFESDNLKEATANALQEVARRGLNVETYSRWMDAKDCVIMDFGSWGHFLAFVGTNMSEIFGWEEN